LVLSGGSAKGLAHIGVLRVLAEAGVRIDQITGTSMGSLVGGLYSIGYSPAELEQVLTAADLSSIFEDNPDRRYLGLDRRTSASRTVLRLPFEQGRLTLPDGLLTLQYASQVLSRLTWSAQTVRHFDLLPIPFAAVATDITNGEAVVLDSGSLAESIRASMALPTLFDPVSVNGRLLVDGGLVRNLPAAEAKARGADLLICSDVTSLPLDRDRVPSILDVLVQAMRFGTLTSAADQRRLCDIYIQPDADGVPELDFDRAPEWIARGDSAARTALPALRQIARAQRSAMAAAGEIVSPGHAAGSRDASVRVVAVKIEAQSAEAERRTRRRLGLPTPAWLNAGDLSAAVQRVYSTGLFEMVTYRLDATDSGTVAVVTATATASQQIGFGVRYDDHAGAALLFSTDVRSWLGYGTTTRFDVRLGNQLRFSAQHVRPDAFALPFTIGGGVTYSNTPLPPVTGEVDTVGAQHVRISNATVFVARPASADGVGGLQLKIEHATGERPLEIMGNYHATYVSLAGVLRYDSFDRPLFPTAGTRVVARSEWSGNGAFAEQFLSIASSRPISSTLSVSARAIGGQAIGGTALPLHYQFFLGGATQSAIFPETQIPVMGLASGERSGTSIRLLSGGVQDELVSHVFASLRVDAASVSESHAVGGARWITGIGASLGAATLLGPIEMTVSTRSVRRWPLIAVNLGFLF
jgi:NTE family protein